MFKILANFYFIVKNKTNLSSLAMNEEDLVASFKSIGRFKSSDLASLSTIDDPAHKLIKHSEEQEPGEIVNKNEILNETLNATITNSNSDEVILENNEIIKIDQDGSSATSTPYIKQQLPPTLNKVDRLIQEAMNKYSSPNTSVVTATSSTPSINFKNLTKSTLTPGIKLKIKDNSIVEDSSNKQENETSSKPIESFNLVIKKNPDSSSSVIIKQAAAAANQATTTTTPIQNLNKNQQFIPKLKISNSANKQIPDSGHSSAVLNFFNNEILKKDNKIDKQSIQALKIKPIIIGSGDEMNDKGNSKDSSFSDKQYQKNRFDEIDQADLIMASSSSSSMKLNFDDDENAMDGVESKKYFSSSSSSSNNNKPNEPLIWKPVFNDSPQSTNNNNNNNNNNEKQKTTLAPPPPIAPFTIKPKQFDLNAKKVAKNNENKISIVDYSSNSNESNSNSHQSNNKKLVETETISSSSNKVNSKDDQSTEKNENTGEISKEKHKKKKKNKDKDKDKKHHHHHHGEKKDKSNTDELQHASSPSSTASSTKKKDKKEKKELKKQQKKLEKAGMINSETSIDQKNVSKTNEEISNDQQLKMNKVNQMKKVFILSIFKSLLYLTKYLHF